MDCGQQKSLAHRFIVGLGLCLATSVGCAHARTPRPEAPVEAMAQTVLEIHRAKQAGAEYGHASGEYCRKAEQALEQSRRLVWRDHHVEAKQMAREGYLYARRARELSHLPAPSPDKVLTSTQLAAQ